MLPKSVLIVLFCLPLAVADEPCTGNPCSNDVIGVLDDQHLAWDESDGAERYELREGPAGVPCATVIGATDYDLPATPCDEQSTGDGYQVRACNAAGCSSWSATTVEVLPYACLRAEGWDPCAFERAGRCVGAHTIQCEYRCSPGAPLRLDNHFPECIDGG